MDIKDNLKDRDDFVGGDGGRRRRIRDKKGGEGGRDKKMMEGCLCLGDEGMRVGEGEK